MGMTGREMLRLAAVGLAVACGSDASDGAAPARTDSAGVEILTHTGADRVLSWRFEPLWRMGGYQDERLQLAGLAAHELAADGAGRIYVLDQAGRQVHILSAGGELLGALGRPGAGPGELEAPMALAVDRGEGVVAVYDFGKGGLVRWSPEGEVLEAVVPEAVFWGPKLEVGRDRVLFTTFRGRTDASTQLALIASSPTSQDTLARFTGPALRRADFPSCGQRGTLVSPLFAPELLWDSQDGRVAVNAGAPYVIDVYEGNRLVRSVRRDLAPREATDAMALRELGDGLYFGAVDCTIPPGEALRGHGYAEVLPEVAALALSPGGELWVLRGAVKGEPNRIDVFRSDGGFRGTLPAGTPFPAAFLPDDRIATVELDSMDVPVVAVYRVVGT